MSARYPKTFGEDNQARYMASNEYAELHGINGVVVSALTAVLLDLQKRELLWFLQGCSLADGGLRRVARELVEMFPERLGTPAMHKAGIKPEKIYDAELVGGVEMELDFSNACFSCEVATQKTGAQLLKKCRDAALIRREKSVVNSKYSQRRDIPSLEDFIISLCINPRIQFTAPGEAADFSEIESEQIIEEHPEISENDFKSANLVYFRDIIGALFEYKSRHEAKAREKFQLTAIGKKIWETLDYALASRRIVVLNGLEGRGKTEALKAWCALHLGTARFVSMKGITSRTTAFREIAKVLGIASSYTRSAPEMQARIEDVLVRSKLVLCIDEAHFLFGQSRRVQSPPELVDWIYSALSNKRVGVALCTTPQFMVCMTRAADQVEWNYRQFRRRAKWIKLAAANTEADIKAVAKKVFKNADVQMVALIAGYALLSKRDLSAVGDVADEVRAMLGTDDLSQATARHVHRAIHEQLLPSDQTFLEGMAAARSQVKKPVRKAAPAVLPPEPEEAAEEAPEATRPAAPVDAPPARGVTPGIGAGSRHRIGIAAELTPA